MDDLATRATRMLRTDEPFRLVGTNRSLHFLRGVFSRASMCIPAFYYFLGSASARGVAKTTSDYPFKIAQTYSEFSDLNTLTLACRKMFDHAAKPDLTGANFSKISDQVLSEHAKHWEKYSDKNADECLSALLFLRSFFSEYSKSDSVLLKKSGCLHKRIGLLKQHADRAAAHLSLEDYALDIIDLAHFTASVTIVGEIVRSFDNSGVGEEYFNEIDEGSHAAAKRIFPQIADFRLFGHMKVHRQARFYWKHQNYESIESYFDQLQCALG
ncbi:hypothetical protein VDG09_07440 [Xanthomonas campestris pv. raphani]|uniref:hypothetical protein n=1 Tax=Xanthomonas campestris TaxID=339 RepID=UPI002B231D13|nr:hypothetical protein [Xanthomonas campestris]MEA9827484.1 hypothetical protein [Xanthomonas campestris pv. raphani]